MSSRDDGSNPDLNEHRFPTSQAQTEQSTTRPVTEADREQIDQARQRGTELESSGTQPSPRPAETSGSPDPQFEVPGFQILQSMMSASLFSDYLHYRAVRTHDLPELEQRVFRFCLDHRCLSWWCTVLDMVTRLLVWLAVYAVLISVAGAVVYKTFISEIFPNQTP